MALAIKSIPVLEGEDAERFVKEAEEKGKKQKYSSFKREVRETEKFFREIQKFHALNQCVSYHCMMNV